MTKQVFSPCRRALLAGLGGTILTSGLRLPAAAQAQPALSLRIRPGTANLTAGGPDTPVWSFEAPESGPALRFKKGAELGISALNELPVPIALNWLGIDGAQAAAPLTVQGPIPAGGRASLALPLRHAGTFLIDARLLGDGAERPSPVRALIVEETEKGAVDRDEVLLIEDWRLKSDGRAIAPGTAPDGTTATYTVNGRPTLDLTTKTNERLRLRFINGCPRAPIGIKIENHEVRVMAIDGQPAEPFTARDGQIVLAPGSRIDALIDATGAAGTISPIILHDGTVPRPIARLVMSNDAPVRPSPLPPAPSLPSNNLPARLDLQGALRTDLSLDPKAQWTTPASFTPSTSPAYRVKRGRTVVMAMTNPTTAPMVFRLHGHHFRLLDRLDDGWKPFWLDTLMLDKGQTQRIAFAAEYPGRWLMESAATNWSAPKLVRCYAVE